MGSGRFQSQTVQFSGSRSQKAGQVIYCTETDKRGFNPKERSKGYSPARYRPERYTFKWGRTRDGWWELSQSLGDGVYSSMTCSRGSAPNVVLCSDGLGKFFNYRRDTMEFTVAHPSVRRHVADEIAAAERRQQSR